MGTLLIGRDVPAFEGGVAHVWIEAPAPADAPARRLAEVRLEGIAHRAGEAGEVAFTIDAGAVPADARLRAWVDLAGRGAPGPDDLFSTEATTVSSSPCVLRVERSGG
jgi:hypothetical protein